MLHSKFGRLLLAGALSLLVIAMVFLGIEYQKHPESLIRFFYNIKYGINIGDGGLLSGKPCSAPCVYGIRAGETSFDQVLPTLKKNGIAGSDCLTEPSVSWFLFNCGVGSLNIQVDTQTNLVNAVWFIPNKKISLGEIIEKYGEPNFVTIDQEGAPGTIHPRFYWNSIRMLVSLPEISGNKYEVLPTTAVEAIDFSDENLYHASEAQSDSYYKPWRGYGTYLPSVTIPLITTPIATLTP